MRCELISGQDLLSCAKAWGHIFELAPQQNGVFGHMKDAIAALSKHDELLPVLLEKLTSPALPAYWLHPSLERFTSQPIGRRQREHEQGKHDVAPYRPRRFLGWMAQAPLLLAFLDTAVLDETAVIVGIKRL